MFNSQVSLKIRPRRIRRGNFCQPDLCPGGFFPGRARGDGARPALHPERHRGKSGAHGDGKCALLFRRGDAADLARENRDVYCVSDLMQQYQQLALNNRKHQVCTRVGLRKLCRGARTMSKRVAPVKTRTLNLSAAPPKLATYRTRPRSLKCHPNCHFWPPAKYCRQVSARIEDGGVKPCLPTLKQWA